MSAFRTLVELKDGWPKGSEATALIAFGEDGPRSWSYGELDDTISRLAAGLVQAGLRRGEPVLLFGSSSPEWVAAYFAVVCAGGTAVPLDELAGAEQLATVVADSATERVFTTREHLPAVRNLDGGAALAVFLLDGEDDDGTGWRGLLSDAPTALPEADEKDVVSLLYTSGTTGNPKAVPLSHKNICANVTGLVAEKILGPDDKVLLPLPLHHVYPFTVGLLSSLASGATVVFPAGIGGPQLVAALKEAKVTVLTGVPRLYSALVAGIESKVAARGGLATAVFPWLLRLSMACRRKLGLKVGRFLFGRLHQEMGPALRLLASGGARLDPDTAGELEALGWDVLTGYGLTETAPVLTFNLPTRNRPESVGVPLPGVEIRIDAGPGDSSGEILARGANVFSGYRNNPEATRLVFTDDGWFRTGDLGYVDKDGFLHIVGRAKEVIVLADGKNVLPEDVETALAGSRFIREAAVLELDGALAALVVPDDEAVREHGAARQAGLLREEIEDISYRLPSYQRVTTYRVTREALPRTNLGKLRRHLLADLFAHSRRQARQASALSDADRQLIATEPAKGLWAWLGERFFEETLSLETSPQLDLHLDSLAWVTLTLEIQERFGIELTAKAVAGIVTLHDLLTVASTAKRGTRQGEGAFETLTPSDESFLAPTSPPITLLGILLFGLTWAVMRGLFRLRVHGAEDLPRDGPVLITPNHASYLDSLAIAAALGLRRLRRTYWAGWAEILFSGPLRRVLSRAAHVYPVDPDRGPATGLALGAAVLRRDQILVWYPEGGLTTTGELRAFLPGVGVLLDNTPSKAIPTRIDGTFEAMPKGSAWPRFRPITVTFGPATPVEDLKAKGSGETDYQKIAHGLHRTVADLKPENRGQKPGTVH